MNIKDRIIKWVRREANKKKLWEYLKYTPFLTVIIMRGIPGSGKTTITENIMKLYYYIARVHSTDDYFVGEDGKYKFNADTLMTNHRNNYNSFCKSLNEGIPIVIVDNTNIRHKWYREYAEKANEMGYQVIEVLIDPDYCTIDKMHKRNKHNVPKKIVENMYNALKNNMKAIEGCQKQFII